MTSRAAVIAASAGSCSLAKFRCPISSVGAEIDMKVVSMMEVQAGADHGHEPRAGRVSSCIEEACVVDLVLLVPAHRDPSTADLESGDVDGIAESMLTEFGTNDSIDTATVVGV